jgi:hypothetical protein
MRELIRKILREQLLTERTFWTKEMVLNLAKNYTKMNDFKKNEPRAYQAAGPNGWLDDVRKLMVPAYEDWSDINKIYKEASKYETLKDFREKSPKAFGAARNKNIINNLKKFLKPTPSNKPTLSPEDVTREAIKYNTRKDFRTKSPLAYRWALE